MLGFTFTLLIGLSSKSAGIHVKLNGTISVPVALRSIVVLLAEDVWR